MSTQVNQVKDAVKAYINKDITINYKIIMKKYKLHNKARGYYGKFLSKKEAVKHMMNFIDDYNKGLDPDDEDYLTPFDFTLEEIECKEVNEVITTYEEAKKYLAGKPKDDYIITNNLLSDSYVKKLVKEVNPKHIKALIAFNRLCTIAQAWNKADGFQPDFSNTSQDKYFPWFKYPRGATGFVCATTNAVATYLYFGSRLCFKTQERATQFGKQFFDIEEDENVTESKQESECKFQSFDKVLVRDSQQGEWRIEFFGFIVDDEFKYRCLYDSYKYCISYNENTKHLLGTTDNWEEEQ